MRPSKRLHLAPPSCAHDSTNQSDASANQDSNPTPARRIHHTLPNLHRKAARDKISTTPQRGSSTTKEPNPLHSEPYPASSSMPERTFKEFVEQTPGGERSATFPFKLGRLEFARVPVRLGDTQALNVEADNEWRAREAEGTVGTGKEGGSMAESVLGGGDLTSDGEKVGGSGDLAGQSTNGAPEGVSHWNAKVELVVEEAPVIDRRITGSIARKMALAQEERRVGEKEGWSREKNATVGSNTHRESKRLTRTRSRRTRGILGLTVSGSSTRTTRNAPKHRRSSLSWALFDHPNRASQNARPPSLHSLCASAQTSYSSPLPSSRRSSTPSQHPNFEFHPVHPRTTPLDVRTSHSHVLRTKPRLPVVDFHPPPPPCVAKINALRVRLENLNGFMDQLRALQNDIWFVEWEFLYLESAKLEDEIEGLGVEWYRLLCEVRRGV